MIAELRGTVTSLGKDFVTLDIHGVGFQVYVTPGHLGTLSTGKRTGGVSTASRPKGKRCALNSS